MAVVEAVEGSAEDHGAVSWGCSLLSSWRWRRSGQGGAVVRGSDHFFCLFFHLRKKKTVRLLLLLCP
jgi:hypothetical protein